MKVHTPAVSSTVKNYKFSQNAFLSKEINIPLAQEYGAVYTSLVKPGDTVKEGDIIAKSGNSLRNTTYIHSSLPGKVLDIAPCFSPSGKQDFAIRIKFGGALSYLGKKIREEKLDVLAPSVIAGRLSDNGVVNTFFIYRPENLGLQVKENSAENLVVRLFDEDPSRLTDSLVSKFYMAEVVKGALAVAKAADAHGIVFAADIKSENLGELKDIVKNIPHAAVVEMTLQKYPCGTPREITSAFRRAGLKKSAGFEITKSDLYIDSSTAYEAYKAAVCSIPEISRNVHFSGNCLYSSCLLDVKIGTPLKDIVSQLGGFAKKPASIIINGRVCGASVSSLEVPVTKYVKSVEFVSSVSKTDSHVYSCVNCGNCRFVCPVKLSPDILYTSAVNFKELPENFAASSALCINCGLCNTVCPSRLPLSQTITVLKENYAEK